MCGHLYNKTHYLFLKFMKKNRALLAFENSSTFRRFSHFSEHLYAMAGKTRVWPASPNRCRRSILIVARPMHTFRFSPCTAGNGRAMCRFSCEYEYRETYVTFEFRRQVTLVFSPVFIQNLIYRITDW